MKVIEVSTEVYAKIWSHRVDGEEDESSILKRLLGIKPSQVGSAKREHQTSRSSDEIKKIRWRDDVRSALSQLGGLASLDQIYNSVLQIRRLAGRSLPVNYRAIIRRELEYNSSDSKAFTGRLDWFRSVKGIGGGIWAIRMEVGDG